MDLLNLFACLSVVLCLSYGGHVLHMNIDLPENGSFSWKNCRTTDPVQIRMFSLSPDPLLEGQTAYISLDFDLLYDLEAPIQANISILVNVGPDQWVQVCDMIPNLEQCVLHDVCAVLKLMTKCPKILTKQGLDCTCPIKKGNYGTEKPYKFELPNLPIAGAVLFRFELKKDTDKTPLFCLESTLGLIG